jgi:hypothetical protein
LDSTVSKMTVTFSSRLSRTLQISGNLYRASSGNEGRITRDYELLDRTLHARVRYVEEWMGTTGSRKLVLKTFGDEIES